MTLDPDTFRAVLGRFATGVTILTARDGSARDHGMTVSAFCAVSLDPPLVLACVDHAASMHELLLTVDRVGISILASGQEALSRRFAELESDRFDGLGYVRGESGVVLFDDALAHLECRVRDRYPAGDHTIFVCEVERAVTRQDRPLLYYRGGYAQLER
ncbi:MAG: flavin reductase family protein [Gemmatimonadota bacterium]|nr:flavin reductase family protein [Gemmatimonadota bacterium]